MSLVCGRNLQCIVNAHPQWKLPARRLHQSSIIGILTRGKMMQKQKQKWGATDGELHVELGGSYRTGQQTALAALRTTLPFIPPDARVHLSAFPRFDGDVT